MKTTGQFSLSLLLAISLSPSLASRVLPSQAFALIQGRNMIYGTVFNESRRPVPDVYVELLDDMNSTLRRAKTNSSGVFTFTGLLNGRFVLKVMPYGTDYLEQSQEITLSAISAAPGSGSDRQNIDIYLRVNERAVAGPFAVAGGVVFAQAIPEEARDLYEEGVKFLREKKEHEGLESLKKSLEVFPDYYLSLDRLGAEYVTRGIRNPAYLQAGYLLLTKAVEINPRGFSSVFGLGWAQYQLRMNAEAIETLRRATTIYGKSPDAYLWLGKALKRSRSWGEAELAFKRANQLSNGKAAEVHWQLAGMYSDQKRYEEAANEMELYLKTAPKGEDPEKIKGVIKQLREKAGAKA